MIGTLFTAPIPGIGKYPWERLFLTVCMLWALTINGTFQSSLIHVYTRPLSYSNIETLAELDNRKIPIGIQHHGLIVDLFGDEEPGKPLGNLRKTLVLLDLSVNLVEEISQKGNIAGLERQIDYPKVALEFVRRDGVSLLHQVHECPRSYTVAFLFPKSSVFLETANYYIGRFFAAGLFPKWYKDTMFTFELQNSFKNREYIFSDKISLNLKHLQIAFFILFGGLSLSLLLFLWELLIKKIH